MLVGGLLLVEPLVEDDTPLKREKGIVTPNQFAIQVAHWYISAGNFSAPCDDVAHIPENWPGNPATEYTQGCKKHACPTHEDANEDQRSQEGNCQDISDGCNERNLVETERNERESSYLGRQSHCNNFCNVMPERQAFEKL